MGAHTELFFKKKIMYLQNFLRINECLLFLRHNR
jgi:hypothetical protein